jgi:hypothetical protein
MKDFNGFIENDSEIDEFKLIQTQNLKQCQEQLEETLSKLAMSTESLNTQDESIKVFSQFMDNFYLTVLKYKSEYPREYEIFNRIFIGNEEIQRILRDNGEIQENTLKKMLAFLNFPKRHYIRRNRNFRAFIEAVIILIVQLIVCFLIYKALLKIFGFTGQYLVSIEEKNMNLSELEKERKKNYRTNSFGTEIIWNKLRGGGILNENHAYVLNCIALIKMQHKMEILMNEIQIQFSIKNPKFKKKNLNISRIFYKMREKMSGIRHKFPKIKTKVSGIRKKLFPKGILLQTKNKYRILKQELLKNNFQRITIFCCRTKKLYQLLVKKIGPLVVKVYHITAIGAFLLFSNELSHSTTLRNHFSTNFSTNRIEIHQSAKSSLNNSIRNNVETRVQQLPVEQLELLVSNLNSPLKDLKKSVSKLEVDKLPICKDISGFPKPTTVKYTKSNKRILKLAEPIKTGTSILQTAKTTQHAKRKWVPLHKRTSTLANLKEKYQTEDDKNFTEMIEDSASSVSRIPEKIRINKEN